MALSLSCPISLDTADMTQSCPKTSEEWMRAAERKNCSSFDQFCGEASKLEYHCVINPSVDQLIEVCAYPKNILLGYCTEYDRGGNIVQGNSRTNCTAFIQSPCPVYYRSNEAYKYPACYDLAKSVSTESNIRSISLSVGSSGLTSWCCLLTFLLIR
uniref:Uncharacterized protein LOC111099993 isoform X2 n=1 Tax=Crassostrea virginica TaxID=6565 RepID=A0A8B8A9K9_CRAVI|nr:uncharacterized protein LOC111099993 isoform X2 [Crassostrea virginica]